MTKGDKGPSGDPPCDQECVKKVASRLPKDFETEIAQLLALRFDPVCNYASFTQAYEKDIRRLDRIELEQLFYERSCSTCPSQFIPIPVDLRLTHSMLSAIA